MSTQVIDVGKIKPIKGQDYWTDTEISTIKTDIKNNAVAELKPWMKEQPELVGAAAGFANNQGTVVNKVDYDKDAKVTIIADPSTPSTAKKFNFTFDIPKGKPAGIQVLDTITLAPGNNASVIDKGTDSSLAQFEFSIPRGDTGNGINNIVLNPDYTLTISYTDGQTYKTTSIRGETGNGISNIALNEDYTLTITYTDGGTKTVGPIRGATGAAAGFGTPTASATSLRYDEAPTITITSSGVDTSKVFDFQFGIPKGEQGNGLKLLGHYNSLQELQTQHPTGTVGDCWSVGILTETTPLQVYIWDPPKVEGASGQWFNIGSVQGATGPQGPKPVAGVDYYTETERQQLIVDTKAAAEASLNTIVNNAKTYIDTEKGIIDAKIAAGIVDINNTTNTGQQTLSSYVTTDLKPALSTYADSLKPSLQQYVDAASGYADAASNSATSAAQSSSSASASATDANASKIAAAAEYQKIVDANLINRLLAVETKKVSATVDEETGDLSLSIEM